MHSTFSPVLAVSCLFDKNHPNKFEVISHYGFDLHFPNDYWFGAPFHVSADHLSSLEKYLFRSFAHFLIGFFFFWYWGFFFFFFLTNGRWSLFTPAAMEAGEIHKASYLYKMDYTCKNKNLKTTGQREHPPPSHQWPQHVVMPGGWLLGMGVRGDDSWKEKSPAVEISTEPFPPPHTHSDTW